jgi:hypothetical protein
MKCVNKKKKKKKKKKPGGGQRSISLLCLLREVGTMIRQNFIFCMLEQSAKDLIEERKNALRKRIFGHLFASLHYISEREG